MKSLSLDYEEFKNLYSDAWKMGCKGITTFRASGKRFGILVKPDDEQKSEACYKEQRLDQKKYP